MFDQPRLFTNKLRVNIEGMIYIFGADLGAFRLLSESVKIVRGKL